MGNHRILRWKMLVNYANIPIYRHIKEKKVRVLTMRKFMKCVVAYFLALMMTFSLVQVSAVKTKAAENIALGGINWSSDKTSYQFSNASVTLPDNTQKILCISVDNGGSFAITDEASLTSLLNTEKATISGVSYDGEDYAYTNTLSLNTKLSSMTVICRSDTSGIM